MMTSAETIARVPGLTYRMLDHWIRCGFLLPLVPPDKPGSGVPREIPPEIIPTLRAMVALTTRIGVRASVAARLAPELASAGTTAVGPITIRWENQ